MRFFITCDPPNVQHIFTTNYVNFPKGAEFAAVYDIMGGSLFTIDGEPCRRQRRIFQSMLSNPRFVASMAACCCNKVENILLPLFSHLASRSATFDMQEGMSRLMFDLATMSLYGIDPGLLSSDMPPMDAAIAMDTVMEVGFLRQGVPGFYWRLMRRLGIGFERKLSAAHKVLQEFITEMIEKRKTQRGRVGLGHGEEQDGVDFLDCIVKENYADDELFRAMLIIYMIAARDTVTAVLPWIFYNLAQNPSIVSIIRDELSPIASQKDDGHEAGTTAMLIFYPEETKSLVYLKAALYETLRLYPPGPFERKTVVADDIMPSGHEVRSGDTIIISFYSMGRMDGVWGNDCLVYNPKRWLSEDGSKLRYVPSHKFVAFNSGPRMCLGKDIAIMLMTTVVAAVVWNFDVHLVEGQRIKPKWSSILEMKDGLKVNLKKRQV
ncbi:hypothetical protein ZWY2020_059364 [Hordeum vulgare]|nr:hypothetical protein ZWY2020_059364 [Hordeum vulgare]